MDIAFFNNLGGPDVILIFLIVLLLFGARKLPERKMSDLGGAVGWYMALEALLAKVRRRILGAFWRHDWDTILMAMLALILLLLWNVLNFRLLL